MKKISLVIGLLLAAKGLFAADGVKFYPAHGVIQKIAPDEQTVTIHHEKIPGYMMEMTMPFTVKNTNELAGLAAGDEIAFRLAVTKTDSWVTNLQFVAHHVLSVTNHTFVFRGEPRELKIGDQLPDYAMTSETGKPIHFSDFRGKVVAFTFFFTRCPLPNFCPRMNNDFSATRAILLADTNAPANWQFLSISFDPDFDSPEVLSNYARLYRGENTNGWLFASAPKTTLAKLAPQLDLMVVRQGNNISHNLRTVVLDPNGKIFRQFDGNSWTAQQLADAMKKAAQVQP